MEDKERKWLIEEKYGGQPSPESDADMARLVGGEPLAYVIGQIPFMNLCIYLDSKPLIPRPETEWWVEKMIKEVQAKKDSAVYGTDATRSQMQILDLCAGSGAIGCAVLDALPEAIVSFGEIDAAHKAVIEKNIRENHLDESRARVCIGDLFAPFAGQSFDIIATNPPYIHAERVLDASVTDFEPAIALRGGTDGLAVIRRIAKEASTYMRTGGELWMEIDSEHADVARTLVAEGAKRADLFPDQFGRPRLIVGYF